MPNPDSQIFIDTSMFKALVDPKDSFHKEAISLWERFASQKLQLLTSNYILDESYTLIRAACGVSTVQRFRETLQESTMVLTIIRVTVADETEAWKWFARDWHKLSFTDCVSFAIMERLALQNVATFDDDFQKAGFHIQK